MESLIIGGLQGLLNYAGISFIDKLNINRYQKKIEKGTATMTQCAKVVTILKADKEAHFKIKSCCEQLLRMNKQTHFANVNLGVLYIHQLLSKLKSSTERFEPITSQDFIQAKQYLENSIIIAKDDSIVEYDINNDLEDLGTLSILVSMRNYHYGYLLHLEGNKKESAHYKELAIKQQPEINGQLPY